MTFPVTDRGTRHTHRKWCIKKPTEHEHRRAQKPSSEVFLTTNKATHFCWDPLIMEYSASSLVCKKKQRTRIARVTSFYLWYSTNHKLSTSELWGTCSVVCLPYFSQFPSRVFINSFLRLKKEIKRYNYCLFVWILQHSQHWDSVRAIPFKFL